MPTSRGRDRDAAASRAASADSWGFSRKVTCRTAEAVSRRAVCHYQVYCYSNNDEDAGGMATALVSNIVMAT